MTAPTKQTPRPVLVPGALYWSDNGRRVCVSCAGASARYTGRDIRGQPVERVTLADVRAWPDDLGPLGCEASCVTLSPIAGADGWPVARERGCA